MFGLFFFKAKYPGLKYFTFKRLKKKSKVKTEEAVVGEEELVKQEEEKNRATT